MTQLTTPGARPSGVPLAGGAAAPPETTTPLATVFDLTESGAHRWRARIDETWRGWSGPHGGVLAALTIAAASRTAGEDVPVRAMDLRFLGRPREGELVLRAEHHPVGRAIHVVDVRVDQDHGTVASASITLGRTAPSAITARSGLGAPEVPAPEACAPFQLPPEIVPVGAHFAIRPAAGPLPLTGSDAAWMTAWIGLIPATTVDAAALAVLADALPPAIFPTLTAPVAVPTVAMSLHLHTDDFAPGAEPTLVRATNAGTTGGWSVDDTDLWDRHGRLLATARQTRRVLG